MIQFIQRQHCPICGQANSEVILEQSFNSPVLHPFLERYYSGRVPLEELESASYQLCHCRACDSLYQGNILDITGLGLLYDEWIGAAGSLQKRDHAALSQSIGYARQAMQVVKALKKTPHELTVLDFGMGWGTWLLMIRAFGMKAIGLELSLERQAYARSLGLEVVTADQLSRNQVDFINAEQVFEHLDQPAQAIQQCHQWLKQGGYLRIAVPNGGQSLQRVKSGQWQASDVPTQPLEHINIFTPASLRSMGRQYGFNVVPAPLVLPAFGMNFSEIKQAVGVLGLGILERLGLYQTTVIWLQKV